MSFFQDHEDSDAWCAKRAGKVSLLLVEKTRAYLIIEKIIISEIDKGKLDEGVLALLASFYIFDSDFLAARKLVLLLCSIAFSRTKMSQLILLCNLKPYLITSTSSSLHYENYIHYSTT